MAEGMDAKLTDKKRAGIRRQVQEVIAAERISLSRLGGIVGWSAAAVSLVLRGKYGGTSDAILNAMACWLADRQSRAEAPEVPFVQTSITRRIRAVCDRAWAMPAIGLVITPSGYGKTAALREVASRRGDRCLYLQAGEAFSCKRDLLLRIAYGLGIGPRERWTIGTIYREVQKAMAKRYAAGQGDPFLILVDEATTLHAGALNLLRNLHDDSACRVAIVLADTWRLDAELHSRKGIAGGYEQLRSRCRATYQVKKAEAVSAADVRKVTDSVLASMGYKGPLDAQAYQFLVKIAATEGALRNVVARLQTVQGVAEAANVRPRYTVAQLDFVAPLVGGECEIEHETEPFGANTQAVRQRLIA